jgi:hypothetical protein
MSVFTELTSLLWWLMLLSSTAIVLHDIGTAVFREKTSNRSTSMSKTILRVSEDESSVLEKKIRRALQRSASFRSLQKEAAEAIVQAALAMHGFPFSRLPESRLELVERILRNPDLVSFVKRHLSPSSADRGIIQRGQMISEFEKTLRALEMAESELK